MTLPLKPIRPKRVSDQVLDQLKELIFRGYLKPGERIAGERELAEAMGVSRPSVREAINKLAAMGLLEQRQGQGTFVQSPERNRENPLALALAGENASLVELLEVRLGLECNAAFLAAQRANEEDISFLEKSLSAMRQDIQSGGLGAEADISFHMAVAYASQNPIQVRVMRSLYDILFFGIKKNLQKLYEDPANLSIILEQHQAIFDTIRQRDSEAARLAMLRHISYVLDFFRVREGL